MKKVLMVAFHYPPFFGGTGVHRTLKFSRYLPDHGWQPIILTVHPRAYPQVGRDQLHEILQSIPVKRAFGLDAAKHLSVRGSYLKWMALPDRWISWWLGAVPAGLYLLRKHQPEIIWSTYPIATAHLIALTLHRLTGLPWVADFRDPMTEEDYPRDPALRRVLRCVERWTVARASKVIFTTPSACTFYRRRFPEVPHERFGVIPNGYDDADLDELLLGEPRRIAENRPLRLLHAGVIYREERDPRGFFSALAELKRCGTISASTLHVALRAPSDEQYLAAFLRALDLDDVVSILPAIPHRRALEECAEADALLLIQGASCNRQIPAKVYEYLRLKRPILALTDPRGDTARLLEETGGATILPPDHRAITVSLPGFLAAVRGGTHPRPSHEAVNRFNRRLQAKALANCLLEATRVHV